MWRGIPVPLLGIRRTCTVNTISVTAQITSSLTAMHHWLQPTKRAAELAQPPPTQKTSLHRPLKPRRTRLEALQFIPKVTTNARALSFCTLSLALLLPPGPVHPVARSFPAGFPRSTYLPLHSFSPDPVIPIYILPFERSALPCTYDRAHQSVLFSIPCPLSCPL
ncbi:hypothetical protein NXS19_009871 [Fusarium pseudograminearum]|nr:hypothetical protein NXS19_009871 [Fusarium pseudograminearum]